MPFQVPSRWRAPLLLAAFVGMAFSLRAELLVASFNQNAVYRFNETNGAYLNTPIASGLSQPFGIAPGTNAQWFIASGDNNTVLRFDGTNPTTFASGGQISFPVGLEIAPDGTLLVCSCGGGRVTRFNTATGASLGNFVATGSGGINGPNFLRFRPEMRFRRRPFRSREPTAWFNSPAHALDELRPAVHHQPQQRRMEQCSNRSHGADEPPHGHRQRRGHEQILPPAQRQRTRPVTSLAGIAFSAVSHPARTSA